jgi:hypothetical protein
LTTIELQQLKIIAQTHMRDEDEELFVLIGEHDEGT